MEGNENIDIAGSSITAYYIGFVFTLLLGGIGIEQAVRYFCVYFNDPNTFKVVVICLTLLNILHSAAFTHIIYFYSVINHDEPDSFEMKHSVNSVAYMTLCSTLIIFIVQLFYSYRVLILSKRPILAIVISLGSLAQLILGIWMASRLFGTKNMTETYLSMTSMVTAWFVNTAVIDILITVCIVYYLQRSKGLISYTNHILNNASRLTLQTNMLTTIVAIVVGVIYLSGNQFSWSTSLVNVGTNLYIISLFQSFNARPIHDVKLYTDRPRPRHRPQWVSYSCLYPDELPASLMPNINGSSVQEADTERIQYTNSSQKKKQTQTQVSQRKASTSSNFVMVAPV